MSVLTPPFCTDITVGAFPIFLSPPFSMQKVIWNVDCFCIQILLSFNRHVGSRAVLKMMKLLAQKHSTILENKSVHFRTRIINIYITINS